jgi:hypothetical protein
MNADGSNPHQICGGGNHGVRALVIAAARVRAGTRGRGTVTRPSALFAQPVLAAVGQMVPRGGDGVTAVDRDGPAAWWRFVQV